MGSNPHTGDTFQTCLLLRDAVSDSLLNPWSQHQPVSLICCNVMDSSLFPRLLDRKIVINDDLPGRILHGAVVIKPNLKGFTHSGVVFEDGTTEENVDTVVFSTGYRACFPFLPTALTEELTLYK